MMCECMYVYMYNIVSWSIGIWKEPVIIPMCIYFEWIYGESWYLFTNIFPFLILIFHIPIHFHNLYDIHIIFNTIAHSTKHTPRIYLPNGI